jgi:hypothetical protein
MLRQLLRWQASADIAQHGTVGHAKSTNAGGLACTTRSSWTGVKCLLGLAVEEVVGRVRLKLSLTHRAGGSRGRSAISV